MPPTASESRRRQRLSWNAACTIALISGGVRVGAHEATAGQPMQGRAAMHGLGVALQSLRGNVHAFVGERPVVGAVLGTSFGWLMTALGAAAVVVLKHPALDSSVQQVLDAMLGVAAGVMLAASYWSLLAPALAYAEEDGYGSLACVPVALGFLSGGALLQLCDYGLARCGAQLEGVLNTPLTGEGRGTKGSGCDLAEWSPCLTRIPLPTSYPAIGLDLYKAAMAAPPAGPARGRTPASGAPLGQPLLAKSARSPSPAPRSARAASPTLGNALSSTLGIGRRASARAAAAARAPAAPAEADDPRSGASRAASQNVSGAPESASALALRAQSAQLRVRRMLQLIIAITAHNFPEGLAVGVAFGALGQRAAEGREGGLGGAISLAIGIGIRECAERTQAALAAVRTALLRGLPAALTLPHHLSPPDSLHPPAHNRTHVTPRYLPPPPPPSQRTSPRASPSHCRSHARACRCARPSSTGSSRAQSSRLPGCWAPSSCSTAGPFSRLQWRSPQARWSSSSPSRSSRRCTRTAIACLRRRG